MLSLLLMMPAMINKAVTIMKKNRAPRINGRYYAVIHPSVAFDLRQSKDWIEAHKYAAPEQLFNGEIGELHGVRFIENVFAPVLGGEDYQNKAGTVTYASYFFGKDAFGIIVPRSACCWDIRPLCSWPTGRSGSARPRRWAPPPPRRRRS